MATKFFNDSAAAGALRDAGRWELRSLFVIVVTAAALRVVTTMLTSGGAPIPLGVDALSYDAFARKIIGGNWLGHPVSYREVGYPFFLSVVYRLSGGSLLAGRLANAALAAGACLLIHRIARRLFGRREAVTATAWFAVYPLSLYYGAALFRETLVTVLLLCEVALVVDIVADGPTLRSNSTRRTLAAAAVFAALVHTDAKFLFHAPFFAACLLFAQGAWTRNSLRTVAVWSIALVVLMVPWQVRNYKAYGYPVLINTRTLVVNAKKDFAVDGSKTDSSAAGETMPIKAQKRRLRGPRRWLYEFTEFYRAFRFRGETRNNSTTWEKPWSVRHNAASTLSYGILLPFFVFGLWRSVRDGPRASLVLAAPIVAQTLLHVIKWGRPRYRAPIDPLIIVLAFYGLWRLIDGARKTGERES